jgi:tRNA(Ile)-lysidine synthase TilS/MesJ
MKIDVPGGKYVVAVSGGVDSVVLLDLLRMYPGVKLTVAHFDHGIRDDSLAIRI